MALHRSHGLLGSRGSVASIFVAFRTDRAYEVGRDETNDIRSYYGLMKRLWRRGVGGAADGSRPAISCAGPWTASANVLTGLRTVRPGNRGSYPSGCRLPLSTTPTPIPGPVPGAVLTPRLHIVPKLRVHGGMPLCLPYTIAAWCSARTDLT